MKKIKSPWYALIWVLIWTAFLMWSVNSGIFSDREIIGLAIVWLIFVGVTIYILVQYWRAQEQAAEAARKTRESAPPPPALNAPCPCGSGKKYKRCCGAPAKA